MPLPRQSVVSPVWAGRPFRPHPLLRSCAQPRLHRWGASARELTIILARAVDSASIVSGNRIRWAINHSHVRTVRFNSYRIHNGISFLRKTRGDSVP